MTPKKKTTDAFTSFRIIGKRAQGFLLRAKEQMEKRHRIRTAGTGHKNLVPRLEELVLAECIFKMLEEIHRMSWQFTVVS